MALLDIITPPDSNLRKVAEPVDEISDEIRTIMADMLETMYHANGIGLAANQVSVLKRLVVIDVSREETPKNPLFFINPEIIAQSEEKSIYTEGCLSLPEFTDEVERPSSVTVRYLDRQGEEHELVCEGLLATCIQHEIDHLNGILFIDYLSRLKRDRILKKFSKQAKLA